MHKHETTSNGQIGCGTWSRLGPSTANSKPTSVNPFARVFSPKTAVFPHPLPPKRVLILHVLEFRRSLAPICAGASAVVLGA
jgi:hypothetical protein